jgi:hypothetical protein
MTWWDLIDASGWWDDAVVPFGVAEGRLEDPTRATLFGLLAGRGQEATFLYVLAAVVGGRSALAYRAQITAVSRVLAIAATDMDVAEPYAPSPEFVWPDDRSWVLNTDYDLTSTYLACDGNLAAAVLSDGEIEAVRVTRQTRVG